MLFVVACRQEEPKKSEVPPPPPATNQPLDLLSLTTNTPNTVQTNFQIRNMGTLRFEMPVGWKAESKVTPSNMVPSITILFTSTGGRDFAVEFVALLNGELDKLDTRAVAEEALRNLRTNALESVLQLNELKGTEISGHYFSITDKNLVDRMPPRGEYKYMIQGKAKMARFETMFVIVSNNPDGSDRRAALEMIRNIRFVR